MVFFIAHLCTGCSFCKNELPSVEILRGLRKKKSLRYIGLSRSRRNRAEMCVDVQTKNSGFHWRSPWKNPTSFPAKDLKKLSLLPPCIPGARCRKLWPPLGAVFGWNHPWVKDILTFITFFSSCRWQQKNFGTSTQLNLPWDFETSNPFFFKHSSEKVSEKYLQKDPQ